MSLTKAAEQRLFNDTFLEQLSAGNNKEASESVNNYTRMKLREASFTESILTPVAISNDELDKAQDPEDLVKWIDREPDTAPAVIVPFGSTADAVQFKGTRYPVFFKTIMSTPHRKDINLLRGYDYDIRGIIHDIDVKEMASALDTNFIGTVQSVIGSVNTANPLNGLGLPQNVTISGGLTKENLAEAFKVIQRLRVPFGPTQKASNEAGKGVMLMNNTTFMDLTKFDASEIGYNLVEKQYVEGVPVNTIMGVKAITTIKNDLIKDGEVYMFAPEDFLGKFFKLQDLTTWQKQEGQFIEWYNYLTYGISLGNIRGMVKATFI